MSFTNGIEIIAKVTAAEVTANSFVFTSASNESHYLVNPVLNNLNIVSTPIHLYGAPAFVIVVSYGADFVVDLVVQGRLYLYDNNHNPIKINVCETTKSSFSTVLLATVPPGTYNIISFSLISNALVNDINFYTRIQTFGTTACHALVSKDNFTSLLLTSPTPSGTIAELELNLLPPYNYVVLMDSTAIFSRTNGSLGVQIGLTGTNLVNNDTIYAGMYNEDIDFTSMSAHALQQAVVPSGLYTCVSTYSGSVTLDQEPYALLYAQVVALPIVPTCASLCRSVPTLPVPYGRQVFVDTFGGSGVTHDINYVSRGSNFAGSTGTYTLPLLLNGASAFLISIDLLSSVVPDNGILGIWSFVNTVAIQTRDLPFPNPDTSEIVIASATNSVSGGSISVYEPVSVVASILTVVPPGTFYALGLVDAYRSSGSNSATLVLRILVTAV